MGRLRRAVLAGGLTLASTAAWALPAQAALQPGLITKCVIIRDDKPDVHVELTSRWNVSRDANGHPYDDFYDSKLRAWYKWKGIKRSVNLTQAYMSYRIGGTVITSKVQNKTPKSGMILARPVFEYINRDSKPHATAIANFGGKTCRPPISFVPGQ